MASIQLTQQEEADLEKCYANLKKQNIVYSILHQYYTRKPHQTFSVNIYLDYITGQTRLYSDYSIYYIGYFLFFLQFKFVSIQPIRALEMESSRGANLKQIGRDEYLQTILHYCLVKYTTCHIMMTSYCMTHSSYDSSPNR